jgi:hypothetical protein
MILSNRISEFSIPHTSTCIVHTHGFIKDGDTVEISSPVFPSFDLTTNALTSASKFNVEIRITNPVGYIEMDKDFEATLVCDDNDSTTMYVRE